MFLLCCLFLCFDHRFHRDDSIRVVAHLRLFGGEWGDIVQTVFIFAAAMLLVLLMFSGTLRARLRVFLSKHFFSYRYDYRQEWLRFIATIAAGDGLANLRVRAIKAIADIVDSPGGAIWLDDVYDGAKSWSDLQAAAGAPVLPDGPHETELRRAVGRLLHIDDDETLAANRRPLRPRDGRRSASTTCPASAR